MRPQRSEAPTGRRSRSRSKRSKPGWRIFSARGAAALDGIGVQSKLREPSVGTHGPSRFARNKTYCVKCAGVEGFPALTVVVGYVGTSGPDRNPHFLIRHKCDGGPITVRMGPRRLGPSSAAIGGHGNVVLSVGPFCVINAH